MRKLYLGILLLVSMFLLVGCDSKKEVEVTYQQANEMLESVNVEALTDEVLTLKGKVDLDLAIPSFMEISGNVSFDLVAKLTTLEDFYVVGDLEGEITQKVTMPQSSEENNKIKFDLKVHIIGKNIYIDGEVTENGKKEDVKFKKSNAIDEDTFLEIKNALSQEGEASTPDLPMLTANSNFKMYKVNDGHLLEMTMTLAEILEFVASQEPDIEDSLDGFKETGENKFSVEVVFDDVIKKVDLSYEVNFSVDMGDQMPGFSFKIDVKSKGEFHLTTKGKAPTMPNMDVLNGYPEAEDDDLIPPIFGF